MAVHLPRLTPEELVARLASCGVPYPEASVVAGLLAHHAELRRWSPRVSLVGPGTVGRLVERHYAESLRGAELVPPGRLLDVGSGAGFPGLVLALACPGVAVTLVERRARKASFLRAAARRMGLRVTVLEGDLDEVLPRSAAGTLDCVSLRAVRLEASSWRAILERLRPGGLVLAWCGRDEPSWPASLIEERVVPLPGSHRRIVCSRYRP